MEKKSGDFLLIVRYIIYFAVIGSIVVLNKLDNNNIKSLIVFLLLYIINTQIRIYFFTDKTYAVITSLIVEIGIISLLYYNFGGFTFVYYFVAIIDASLMLNKKYSYIITSILYLAVIFQSMTPLYKNLQEFPIANIIFNTVIVMGFGGLGRFIAEEKARKQEAQLLYDKIRVSEQELKEAYDRLEEYSNTVEELSVLRERDRISREIHDTVGHTLSTLNIQIQALPFLVKSDKDKAIEMLNDMYTYSKNGLEDVRRAVRELSPISFENNNSIFVLKELANNFQKNTGIKVEFNTSKSEYIFTSDQNLSVYRIIQEALNNSLRHGKATVIEINLHFTEKEVGLNIKDNGEGVENLTPDFGLRGMQDRVNNLGGKIEFFSEKNSGFEINIIFPKKKKIL
jgi:signal transduction histidine kinase